jgi:hypothetical protein
MTGLAVNTYVARAGKHHQHIAFGNLWGPTLQRTRDTSHYGRFAQRLEVWSWTLRICAACEIYIVAQTEC